MKKLILIISGLLLLSACPGNNTANNAVNSTANNSMTANNSTMANNSANGEMKTADLKAFDDEAMSADERVSAIDAYVESIEAKLPPSGSEGTGDMLKRKETDLSSDSFEDVTQEKWAKMDTYYDGEKLMRLKVYSAEGQKKTEEFYFYNDKPVYAFIENDGMGKKGDATEAKGDKFYFGSEGMFAMTKADGTKVNASSEEFIKYKDKLPNEASAFRGVAK
jgi:hypothetical protein